MTTRRPPRVLPGVHPHRSCASKERRERLVLREVCKAATRHLGENLQPVERWQRCVQKIEGATVDGVVRTPTCRAAIELLGYSPPEDRGDVLGIDDALRRLIKNKLGRLLRARRVSLHLEYTEQPRARAGEPPAGLVKHVPPPRVHARVVEEIRGVLRAVTPVAQGSFRRIKFAEAARCERLNGRDSGVVYLDADRYPLCATHMRSLRIRGLREDSRPQVDSLTFGMVGLNGPWLDGKLRQKAAGSLGLSRARAGRLPLWLVIHSDGRSTNQVIPEPQREQAVALVRRVLGSIPHAFERVYLAGRTGSLDAAWVHRVL